MKKLIRIINGPNLNLLGTREPEIYGNETFESYLDSLAAQFSEVDLSYNQSNWEGGVIDLLHDAGKEVQGVILNAGAYSHTSIAIADAVAALSIPVVGVHISNIYAREYERRTDLLAKYCRGFLFGFGLKGYELGLRFLIGELEEK
ncbi:MAG: 3-dehydroquinate dehydratase [Flavobacteriales bacterium]|nr:3-dehydroquinate dehydratase [Flavobacteriales bacterium]